MDRKYKTEVEYIHKHAQLFYDFVISQLDCYDACDFFNALLNRADVYIFSGLTRNYLMGFRELRDLDLVVDCSCDLSELVQSLLPEDNIVKLNSFGGIKICINHLNIDIWSIEKTWGIIKRGIRPNIYGLLKTPFFNFSSIVFDCKKKRFFFTDNFCDFLHTRIMDVVYKDNPNKSLCIVNALYYTFFYGFSVGTELSKWIVNNHIPNTDFDKVQQSHWGIVRFSNRMIQTFVEQCRLAIEQNQVFKVTLIH